MTEQELKEYYNKGMLAYEKQNYGYAIEIFSQILLIQYDHLDARHYLHLSLKNKMAQTPPSALSNVAGFLNRLFLFSRADSFFKKNDVAGSLETLEKILSGNPSDTETLKKMADVFLKKNLMQHAITTLEEAKAINPKDITALKKLGELYLKKEDYQNAKVNYEVVLKINPHDTDALKSLKNLDALGTLKREFGS